jgi:hypothetical protein
MVEDIFIDDLRLRGVEVIRSSPFNRYSAGDSGVQVECNDLNRGGTKILKTQVVTGHIRRSESPCWARWMGQVEIQLGECLMVNRQSISDMIRH